MEYKAKGEEEYIEDVRVELAEWLATWMTREELSQFALAKKMGIHQPDVSKLLSVAADMNMERLLRYAYRLGFRIELRVDTILAEIPAKDREKLLSYILRVITEYEAAQRRGIKDPELNPWQAVKRT